MSTSTTHTASRANPAGALTPASDAWAVDFLSTVEALLRKGEMVAPSRRGRTRVNWGELVISFSEVRPLNDSLFVYVLERSGDPPEGSRVRTHRASYLTREQALGYLSAWKKGRGPSWQL